MAEYNGSTYLISGLARQGEDDFPLVNSPDVLMPDGSRLSEIDVSGAYAIVNCSDVELPVLEDHYLIEHGKYYVFGEVDELKIYLIPSDDGKIHEYTFEFIPTENFSTLEVMYSYGAISHVRWVSEPSYTAGKTCQVSIVRGVGVIVSA